MDKAILNSTNYLIEELSIYPLYSDNEDKIDIINLVQSLKIYESIFTNSITCEIVIADSLSLVESFPIISGERIVLYISKHDEIYYSLEFVITKISDYRYKNDVTKVYKLTCSTYENIRSLQNKVSRSFRNKRISSMISSIFNNYIKTDKNVNIEETKYSRSIIIPNYSPFRAINWLCSQAVSSEYNGASLLFYENKNGFYIRSLESIYNDDDVATYRVRFAKLNDSIVKDLFTIYQLSSGSMFDYIKSITNGIYSSRLCTYDPVRKKFKITGSKVNRNNLNRLSSYSHLYKSEINPDSTWMFYPTDTNRKENSYFSEKYPSQQPSYNVEMFKQKRISTLGELEYGIKFLIIIPGNFDIKAGDVIYLNIDSTIPNNYNSQDQIYSGRYIITSLKHNMVNDNYTIEAEIIKDGVEFQLDI